MEALIHNPAITEEDASEISLMLIINPNQQSWGQKARSPYTRTEFMHRDVVPVKCLIDMNYKGKCELLFNFQKNSEKTIKNIESYYK